MKVEISRPHYHPGKDFDMTVTKKRDLSVPPHWVTNEKMTNPETGQMFSIIMPPRDEELYELRQPVHIHTPEFVEITVNGKQFLAKVKVVEGQGTFKPVVHFDHEQAELENINTGDEATL